eukprot:786249-Pelagomonas_calceolata.AAC.9
MILNRHLSIKHASSLPCHLVAWQQLGLYFTTSTHSPSLLQASFNLQHGTGVDSGPEPRNQGLGKTSWCLLHAQCPGGRHINNTPVSKALLGFCQCLAVLSTACRLFSPRTPSRKKGVAAPGVPNANEE